MPVCCTGQKKHIEFSLLINQAIFACIETFYNPDYASSKLTPWVPKTVE